MGLLGQSYPAIRAGTHCAATGREFAPGERVVAALYARPGAPIARADYSADAWDAGARPEGDLVGFWRHAYTPESRSGPAMLGDDELMDLFEELAGASEPRQVAFRYFLTLLLIRRRALRLMGTRPGLLLVLPRGGTGEPLEITDPGLDDGVVADAIDQLGRVLGTTPDAASQPPTGGTVPA